MTGHSPRCFPNGKHEAVFEHDDESGVEVLLRMPDDLDLLEPLNNQTLAAADAIEVVAERRRQERELAEIERQEREQNAWRQEREDDV